MAETATTPMTQEQGAEVLFRDAYVPAFIKACADQGIQIANTDELAMHLENVALLKQAEAQLPQPRVEMAKTANDMLRSALQLPTQAQEQQAADVAAQAVPAHVKQALAAVFTKKAEQKPVA